MVTFPNAKINIGLFVTGKLPDGYHTLEMTMIPTAWRDILEIVPAKGSETTLTVSGRSVDCPPEKNLVMKAYRRLAREVELPPLDIYLRKIIPDGAGLGGGSADAAFTLLTLNEMFALGFSDERLADMASEIGSDCPFFIYNRPMYATGTGTVLSPLDMTLEGYTLLIAKPEESVSTAEAYSRVTPRRPDVDLRAILTSLPPERWEEAGVKNDFEASVFPLHPAIADLKRRIIDLGAVYAAMSGSGSAVFGIFKSDKLAEEAATALTDATCFVSK